MWPGEDEIAVTAHIGNHLFLGVIAGFIAAFSAIGIPQFLSQADGTKMVVVLVPTFALMLYAAISNFSKVINPTKLSLQPDGISLTISQQTRFVPWQAYKGLRGGPNLIIRIGNAAGKEKWIPLGIWPVNLEVLIFEYAQKHSVVVPIRESARHQVSVTPLFWIAGGLVAFALAVAAYSLAL